MTTPPPYEPPTSNVPGYAGGPPPESGKSKKPWIFGGIGAVVLILVIVGVAGGGGDGEETSSASSSTPSPVTSTVTVAPTTTAAPAPAVPVAPSTPATTETSTETTPAVMPQVVCMNLQDAQDLIQEAGVFFSRSDDATGQGRRQVLDRNWVVVGQTPAAGQPVGEAEAVLSVVKEGEPSSC